MLRAGARRVYVTSASSCSFRAYSAAPAYATRYGVMPYAPRAGCDAYAIMSATPLAYAAFKVPMSTHYLLLLHAALFSPRYVHAYSVASVKAFYALRRCPCSVIGALRSVCLRAVQCDTRERLRAQAVRALSSVMSRPIITIDSRHRHPVNMMLCASASGARTSSIHHRPFIVVHIIITFTIPTLCARGGAAVNEARVARVSSIGRVRGGA